MKLLLENWREYLDEGMKTVDNLPEGVGITIQWYPDFRGGSWLIFYSSIENPEEDVVSLYGEIAMNLVDAGEDKAWQIHSEADEGWGPLLYDIAMEWGTKVGGGVIPDDDVSDDARGVWDYYLNNRQDVKVAQVGEPDDSPLTKKYTKGPATLDKLQKTGRLAVIK